MPRPGTGAPVYTRIEADARFEPLGRGIARRIDPMDIFLWAMRTASWQPAVNAYLHADGSVSHDLTMATFMAGANWPSFARFYVDPVNGDDLNDGSTWLLAKRTIRQLVGTSDNKVIILPNGSLFDLSDGIRAQNISAHTVIMTEDIYGEPARITSRMQKAPPAWTWDAAEGLWKWVGAPVDLTMGSALDLAHNDTMGNPLRFVPWGTLADCKASTFRLYRDVATATVYLNHPSGALADMSSVVVHYGVSLLNNGNAGNAGKWCRVLNVDFEGSGATLFSSSGPTGNASADNGLYRCRMLWCGMRLAGNGPAAGNAVFGKEPGSTILWEVEAVGSSSDGFNWQDSHKFVEVDCIGHRNGYRADDDHVASNQGSTSHGAFGLRIGGFYGQNGGPGVQDVKSGGVAGMTLCVGSSFYSTAWLRVDSDNADVVSGVSIFTDEACVALISPRWVAPDGTASTSPRKFQATSHTTFLIDVLPPSGEYLVEPFAKAYGGLI